MINISDTINNLNLFSIHIRNFMILKAISEEFDNILKPYLDVDVDFLVTFLEGLNGVHDTQDRSLQGQTKVTVRIPLHLTKVNVLVA